MLEPNKHPLAVEPQTVATTQNFLMSREVSSQTREPFCCEQTAHFFLSYRYSTRDTMLAMEPRAPRTARIVEVICIASFGTNFPRRLRTRLHSAFTGCRQPSFTVHRLPKRRGRWDFTELIIQMAGKMSIKIPEDQTTIVRIKNINISEKGTPQNEQRRILLFLFIPAWPP